jgi:large subunit ribosomal protein L20
VARVQNTPARLRRKRRILKAAKGYFLGRSKLHKVVKETVHRAWAYAYRGRKLKKREFRSLWIRRINAAARARGIPYGRFVHGLTKAGVTLDRKVLSEIAIHDPAAFDGLVQSAQRALDEKKA